MKGIISTMERKGYTRVTRYEYHKVKRKFHHGCWKVDKEYEYFINYDELSSEEMLKQIKKH